MLLLLLSATWMLLLPFAYGSWLLGRLRRWGQPYVASEGTVSLLVIWWLGLALLTAVVEAWALAAPLQWPVFVAVVVLAIACMRLDRASWQATVQQLRLQLAQQRLLGWLIGGLVGALLLALATLPPTNGDTGRYHAPAIRWLEEAGVVPGLANLDSHLGYNPSWFSLEVLSSWGQWLGSPLQSLNMLILLLFALYALGGLRQPSGPGLFRLLLGIVMLFWLGGSILSLSPDPAATGISFLILSQVLELGVPGPTRPLTVGHLAIMVLACYAITIKFSVAPLGLVPLAWLWLAPQALPAKARLVGRLAGICLLLVLPWMLSTVVLTGYLLFPFPALDVLPVAWKYPRPLLYEHVAYIRNFARSYVANQYDAVYGQPLRYWLPIWWQQQQVFDRLLTLALPGLAVLGAAVMICTRTWRKAQAASWWLTLAIALLGIGFWFVAAPAYRFGYPFILPLACLLLVPPLLAASRVVNLRPWLALGMLGAMMGSAALVELTFFGVPRRFTAVEFKTLRAHLPAGASRDMIVSCYQPTADGQYALRSFIPSTTKLKLIANLLRSGQLQPNGLLTTGYRWLQPVSYPLIACEPFRVGNLTFLRRGATANSGGFWYAPFPAVTTDTIRLRTGTLAGGFLPIQALAVPTGQLPSNEVKPEK